MTDLNDAIKKLNPSLTAKTFVASAQVEPVCATPLAAELPRADGFVGWVVRSTVTGWELARVALPAEYVQRIAIGGVFPGDLRGMVGARIETDFMSDRLKDPTRWRP